MKKNAFTLVELLGIITIIGIILLMAVPSLTGTLKRSEEKECTNYKKTIDMAAENYFFENKSETSVEVQELEKQGYLKEDKLYKDDCETITRVNRNDVIPKEEQWKQSKIST